MNMHKKPVLKTVTAVFILSGTLLLAISCATHEKAVVERALVKGVVEPVDAAGKEIEMQDRGGIIVNCIPVKNGVQTGSVITVNTERDGSFSLDIPAGEYVIEIFLEGFYVQSFHLDLTTGKRNNLGRILLKKIEVGEGMPLKDGGREEDIGGEGDVTIQPPAL